MAKQWYVKQGLVVLGPLSSDDLKYSAGIGHLATDSQISPDGVRWYPASSVKGLKFKTAQVGNEIVPSPPSSPPAPPPPPSAPFPPTAPTLARTSSSSPLPCSPSSVIPCSSTNTQPQPQHSRSMVGMQVVGGVGIVVVLGVVLVLANVKTELEHALQACSARDGIDVRVYYDDPLSRTNIVLDFRGVTGSSVRRIDPVHLLLQFGSKVNTSPAQRLILARDGRKLFYLRSSDLKELCNEYTVGNPVWSLNHLPERVMRMNDQHAYGQWEGGWLNVLKKQTEDLDSFMSDWTGP